MADVLVVPIRGAFDPPAVADLCAAAHAALVSTGAARLRCCPDARLPVDLMLIDVLARLYLTARRLDRCFDIAPMPEGLAGLIDLLGLTDVLVAAGPPCRPGATATRSGRTTPPDRGRS